MPLSTSEVSFYKAGFDGLADRLEGLGLFFLLGTWPPTHPDALVFLRAC